MTLVSKTAVYWSGSGTRGVRVSRDEEGRDEAWSTYRMGL